MGKRKKRMMKAKYAKKYALKRAALGFDKIRAKNALIIIDPDGQEEKGEGDVQVVTNTPKKTSPKKQKKILDPEPQLMEIEEPPTEIVEEIVPPKPKPRRRRARKKSTTTTTSSTTRTRRTATKTKE